LTQIERMLDVFEPGQIALAYNGGKDSTCLLELVRAACSKHPTHKFSHVQPVWFQTPGQEFPELVEFVK
jgi:3'-phosphoadenosine 5'-phosphosulfate sulfotransferase (PAPS reductase)/FAD synthetase